MVFITVFYCKPNQPPATPPPTTKWREICNYSKRKFCLKMKHTTKILFPYTVSKRKSSRLAQMQIFTSYHLKQTQSSSWVWCKEGLPSDSCLWFCLEHRPVSTSLDLLLLRQDLCFVPAWGNPPSSIYSWWTYLHVLKGVL